MRKNLRQASKEYEAKVQELSKAPKGREESSIILPEQVLEKIVAMMPFPDIFQARTWSKSWLAKFSSTAALDDGEKLPATLFQKSLVEWSTKWKTLPTYRWNCIVDILVSQTLRKIPSLSPFPQNPIRSKLQISGALCFFDTGPEMNAMYVANILTRSWKQLPPRPPSYESCFGKKLINDESSETYRVVLCFVYRRFRDMVHPCGSAPPPDFMAQIYDSRSDAWTSRVMSNNCVPLLGLPEILKPVNVAAYLHGILYVMVVGLVSAVCTILEFNIEEGTVDKIQTSERLCGQGELVVYDANVFLIRHIPYLSPYDGKLLSVGFSDVHVQIIDRGSRKTLTVAYGPTPGLEVYCLSLPFLPVVDGDRLLLGLERVDNGRVLVYNMKEDHWSCSPCSAENEKGAIPDNWDRSSFRPCLKPFVEV